MNERQKLVLLIGVGAFFGMLVYCPWKEVRVLDVSDGGGLWCGGLVRTEETTVYDWSLPALHSKKPYEILGEPTRDRNRLRWQFILLGCCVLCFFRALHSYPHVAWEAQAAEDAQVPSPQ